MTKPKLFTDEQQIAVIDRAVTDGWRIMRVDLMVGNPSFSGSFATVVFAKEIAPPYPSNDLIRYDGFETVTQEFGCGFKAGNYAADLMKESA